MKPFNLEEYLKNPSRKVVTRDGKPVRILCTDDELPGYPIIGKVTYPGGTFGINTFTKEGRYLDENKEDNYDLFFATKVGWVNVYRGRNGKAKCAHIYDTEEEALENRGVRAISTVKIEWED